MEKPQYANDFTEKEINYIMFWASVIVTFAAYIVVMYFMDGVAEDRIIIMGIVDFFLFRLFEPMFGKYAKYFYVVCVPIGCVFMTIVDGQGRFMAVCECDFVWILLSSTYGQVRVVICCAFITLLSNIIGVIFFPTAFLNTMVMIGWIYCLIMYIISFIIALSLAARANQWQLMEQKIKAYEQELVYFQELQKRDETNSRFVHDIGHYLKAIGELARTEEYSGITGILQELDVFIEEKSFVIYTNHRMLNAILLAKSKEAKEKEIDFNIIVEPDVKLKGISDGDLAVILGNLLDNAVYAVSQLPDFEENKQVLVRIYMEKGGRICVINIQNSFQNIIAKNQKGYLSSKRNHKQNGIGLKSVEITAKKYAGYLECSVKENKFCAIVVLPIQNI